VLGGKKMKTWVDQLIEEYEIGKKELEKLRKRLDLSTAEGEKDHKIIGGMIKDMEFALEWMKKGRRPGNRRGIEKRNVYQRNALINIELFPDLKLLEEEPTATSDEMRKKIIEVLAELSVRERECFLLHMAKCMSFKEISEELGISRATVQVYVKRAKEKIKKIVS